MSKTVLITGAGSGLGRLAAFGVARKGHRVIATTHTWSRVTDLKKEAQAQDREIQVEKLDVTSEFDRRNALNWDIDVLVSNAGVMEAGPIAEQPIELLRTMFEVNFFSSLELVQGFAKKMATRKRGKIVFVSSVAGLMTAPFGAGYCATKHAIEALAEALRAELGPLGIKVATINPAAYATGFNDRGGDSVLRWYDPKSNFTPPDPLLALKEIWANQYDPQSIADAIVDIVLTENGKFRNVLPPEAEDTIKQIQQAAWQMAS